VLLRATSAVAAGLLVVLVVHLAYMASPLHATMVEPQLGGREMVHGDADVGAVEAADADNYGHDCSIEWTTSTQAAWFVLTLVPPVGSIHVLQADQPSTRPTAQALGPPQRGDSQALLQVFRC
jgi:hypothetical protein